MSLRRHGLILWVLLTAGCVTQASVVEVSPEAVQPSTSTASASRREAVVEANVERQLMAAVNDEESIFFPLGGTEVDTAGKLKLQAHAQRLKDDPSKVVTLIGHTDDLGSPSYNLAIAQGRVNAVHEILRARGVPQIQIRRYGVGSEKNSLRCQSEACRQKMRRVQMIFGG